MNGKKTDAPNSFTAASKGQKNATEISLKVEPLRLRLMQAVNFKETVENRHPGVKVEMNESNQQIVFRGPGQIARKAQSDARRLLRSAMSGKATQLTDTQKTVLGTTQGAQYVDQILKCRGVVAVWDTGPQGDMVIHAFSENDLHGAAFLIHHAIANDWLMQADVLVNTTSTDLDLAKGAVSSSILKAGGSSLQEECQHKYPVGIKPGEIAHTKGHGLACKEVYHIALEAWSSGAEKVGVIVNSTSPELDLGRGAVSASILKVGGSSLQEECRQKYPSGIKAGKIAHTRGHGLACKEVYHLALTTWSSAASQGLCTVLFECLERASKNHYTSMAFPALGTGKFSYPCENVARIMFAVVALFRQAMPTSSLREVRIVLHPNDRSAIQAFRAIESQSSSGGVAATPESKDTSKEATPGRIPRFLSKYPGINQARKLRHLRCRPSPQRRVGFPAPEVTFEFPDLVLKILQGDITKEDVDLLVIRTNSQLALTMVPELQKTGLAMAYTGGGMVLFVDSFRFSADLKKAYKSCLEKADSVCVKSVAIPPLGTRGLAGSDQKIAKEAKVFIKTVTKFCNDKQRSVKELRVVTDDLTLLRTFADVVRTKLEKKGIKFTCQENLSVAVDEDPSSPPLQQHDSLALKEASLFIFADDPRNIETAVNEFRELVKDTFIERTMSDDKVMSLNDEQARFFENTQPNVFRFGARFFENTQPNGFKFGRNELPCCESKR
nr:hypothetical protein BaRGS_007227 [Batillaria attramentaria]